MQIGVDSSKAVDNKRVFVVDRDEIVRMVLTYILHDETETHDLPDLDAAFSKAIESQPDLLLLGSSVLNQQEEQFIPAIKARMRVPKVMLISESADDPLARDYLRYGADGVLCKPLSIGPVRKQVDAMLGRRQRIVIPLHAL